MLSHRQNRAAPRRPSGDRSAPADLICVPQAIIIVDRGWGAWRRVGARLSKCRTARCRSPTASLGRGQHVARGPLAGPGAQMSQATSGCTRGHAL